MKTMKDRLAVTILDSYGTQIYEIALNEYHAVKDELRNMDNDTNNPRRIILISQMEKLSDLFNLIMSYQDN